MTKTDEYDYDLPGDLIAQEPISRRSDARLLVVNRRDASLHHAYVRDLPEILKASDTLVLNDSRVIPARLVGHRLRTMGRWEGLYLGSDANGVWELLSKTRGRLVPGEEVALIDMAAREHTRMRMIEKLEGGTWLARPQTGLSTDELLEQVGRVPLPHYIRNGEMLPQDRATYQTVYARHPGSVAAPTAGLHFTPELFSELEQAGVARAFVTLHVGIGTFRPLATPDVESHRMHSERGEIPQEVMDRIVTTRERGGRVVAVGTTSTRILETAARREPLAAWNGETDLFIYPPFEFKLVDALLTNFHLPRSTLLVLVRTFGGDALIRHAYEMAIRERYRFYSYGDAMLIL